MKKLLLAAAFVACSLCLLALTAESQGQGPLGVQRYSVPNVLVVSETNNPYYVTNPNYKAPRPTPEPELVLNPFTARLKFDGQKTQPPRSLFSIIVHDTGATDAQNALYRARYLSGQQTK